MFGHILSPGSYSDVEILTPGTHIIELDYEDLHWITALGASLSVFLHRRS